MSTVSKLSMHSNDCQSSGKPYMYFPIFMNTHHLLELHFLWLFHPFWEFFLNGFDFSIKSLLIIYLCQKNCSPSSTGYTPINGLEENISSVSLMAQPPPPPHKNGQVSTN